MVKIHKFNLLVLQLVFIVWVWFSTLAVKSQEFSMKALSTFYSSANFFACFLKHKITRTSYCHEIPSLFLIIFCIRLILRGDIHWCLYTFVFLLVGSSGMYVDGTVFLMICSYPIQRNEVSNRRWQILHGLIC